MSDVFRVIDKFNITGRGTVYIINNRRSFNALIGDVFCDLRGNRFKLKGAEMIRRTSGNISDDDTIGVMFELVDGSEVEGNILVKTPLQINFLFCNSPLYPKRPDEDYEQEYKAAKTHYSCALFSFEDINCGKLSLYGEKISGLTIYRGWMMSPETYMLLYEKLEEENIILINSPQEYETFHLLPGWYNDFKEYTAFSVWEDKGTLNSVMEITKGLTGSYIVKDYVKSRKHEWYDACFISNIADKVNTSKVVGNFIERQGSDLVGGVVLRQYEKLKPIGFHEKSGMPISEEYRAFIFAGRILIVDSYWKKDDKCLFSDDEILWIRSLIKKVKSNFVTIDLARREDGRLIIIEMGDGQVSGLQEIDPEDFYKSF